VACDPCAIQSVEVRSLPSPRDGAACAEKGRERGDYTDYASRRGMRLPTMVDFSQQKTMRLLLVGK